MTRFFLLYPFRWLRRLFRRQRRALFKTIVNTFVFGATRTGKTVCTGRTLISTLVKPRVGFLGLCVKVNEGDNLVSTLSRSCPREQVIHVTPGSKWTFDPLSAYYALKGASATEAAKMLVELSEMAGRFQGKPSEPFWAIGTQRCLYYSLCILEIAFTRPTTAQLYQFLTCLPDVTDMKREKVGDEIRPSRFDLSFAGRTAKLAIDKVPPSRADEFMRAWDWLTQEWPAVPDRTRSGFQQGAIQAAFPFMQAPVADLCKGNTLGLELLNQGYKIILDVPVLRWGLPALLWQGAVRYITDLAMLDRPRTATPVIKYCDEYQWLAMPAHDARVATVSSESRYTHCFLAQSVQTMLDALGGTDQARAQMDSILGNSVLKIFHWTDCEHTQKLMAQLSGQMKEFMASSGGGDAANYLKPEWGQQLKRAGLPHGYSESLVIEAGKPARIEQIPMILFKEK
jgi:hypothetical protein